MPLVYYYWYDPTQKQARGPLRPDEVRDLIETGVIVPAAYLVRAGESAWQRADTLAEFAGLFQARTLRDLRRERVAPMEDTAPPLDIPAMLVDNESRLAPREFDLPHPLWNKRNGKLLAAFGIVNVPGAWLLWQMVPGSLAFVCVAALVAYLNVMLAWYLLVVAKD